MEKRVALKHSKKTKLVKRRNGLRKYYVFLMGILLTKIYQRRQQMKIWKTVLKMSMGLCIVKAENGC